MSSFRVRSYKGSILLFTFFLITLSGCTRWTRSFKGTFASKGTQGKGDAGDKGFQQACKVNEDCEIIFSQASSVDSSCPNSTANAASSSKEDYERCKAIALSQVVEVLSDFN